MCYHSYSHNRPSFHRNLHDISMIEEKSVIQPTSFLEQTSIDNSQLEAEPLFYNQQQPQPIQQPHYPPATLVEYETNEQFVTVRKSMVDSSDEADDFF